MLEFLKAVIFGIVEGITEWLPISSTGHMILLNELMPLKVSADFYSMFEVVIQLGAIMAVVVLFWQKIWPFQWKDKTKPVIKKDIFVMWFQILAACIPAAVVGLLFDDVLEKYLYNYVVVALALIVFGIAFILVENRNRGMRPSVTSLSQMTYKTALIIGMFQLIAAIFLNLEVRSDHCRRAYDRSIENRGGGVHVFSGNSGYVRREPVKTRKAWVCLYGTGGMDFNDRYVCRFCSVSFCAEIFVELY